MCPESTWNDTVYGRWCKTVSHAPRFVFTSKHYRDLKITILFKTVQSSIRVRIIPVLNLRIRIHIEIFGIRYFGGLHPFAADCLLCPQLQCIAVLRIRIGAFFFLQVLASKSLYSGTLLIYLFFKNRFHSKKWLMFKGTVSREKCSN